MKKSMKMKRRYKNASDLGLKYFVPTHTRFGKPFLGFAKAGGITISQALVQMADFSDYQSVAMAHDSKDNWYICKAKGENMSFKLRRNSSSKNRSGVFSSIALKNEIAFAFGLNADSKFRIMIDNAPIVVNGIEYWQLIPPTK